MGERLPVEATSPSRKPTRCLWMMSSRKCVSRLGISGPVSLRIACFASRARAISQRSGPTAQKEMYELPLPKPSRMYVFHLGELKHAERDLIGGKALGLAQLCVHGFTIPPTGVVITKAYDAFLEERVRWTRLYRDFAARSRDPDKPFKSKAEDNLDDVAKRFQSLFTMSPLHGEARVVSDIDAELGEILPELGIGDEPFNPGLAVRSSASLEDSRLRSFAGAFFTQLNVRTRKALRHAILNCWASVWQREFLLRKKEHAFGLRMAVVIQVMVEPEVSGVSFTSFPDRGHVLLEAAWGLGKGVVDGVINPDVALVDVAAETVDYRIGTKATFYEADNGNGVVKRLTPVQKRSLRCLTDEQVLGLSRMCKKAEDGFGYPLDVEWSFSRGHFYFLQARPLVAIPKQSPTHSAKGRAEASERYLQVREQLSSF